MPNRDNRRTERVVVEKNVLAQDLPESLIISDKVPVYTVAYVEADPVQFALKRKNMLPLIDICDDGLAFFIKAQKDEKKVVARQIIQIQIDFPILIEPIKTNIEIQWTIYLEESGLLRVGAKFCDASQDFKKIIKSLIKYVQSKPISISSADEINFKQSNREYPSNLSGIGLV